MKGIFKGRTIKSKLIGYNFILISVIAIFVSICSYMTANRRTKQIAENSLVYHVENIAYRYRMAYEEMLNIVLNCTDRKVFALNGMEDYASPELRRRGLTYVQLLSDYCAVTGYGSYISKLSVFNEQGVMIQTGTSQGSNDDYCRILQTNWFSKELNKTMDFYQLDLVESPFYADKGSILPIARRISGEDGWVLLCLSDKLFQDGLRETASGRETIVVTSLGKRVASMEELEEHREENDRLIARFLTSGEDQGLLELTIHGKPSLAAYERDDRSGLMVYEVIPLDSLTNDKLLLIQTIAAMFVACLVIGLLLSVVFTYQVKKPIDHLVAHIKAVAKGEFKQDASIETEDEIGTIGKVVNRMSGQIESLMRQQLEDEKEKSNLELKMLQAQINPHFLYNTLDSIKWIAMIQKNSGIVKVVTALSGLLKNMAKGYNEKVTLSKELEFLNDYVTIEKVKYVELFDLSVEIDDPALYQAKVIKLTLQPLVENAIFSGIEPSGKNGLIRIHARAVDQTLILTVRDNGVGIPEDQCSEILSGTDESRKDHMSGIGLSNVDKRIKLAYGQQYGLRIDSEVGVYTQITVTMPLEYDEDGGGIPCTE